MRIVDVIRTSEGGLWIVPALRHLSSRGHDVTVILPDPEGRLGLALSAAGIEAIRSAAPMDSGQDAMNLFHLRRLRRQLRSLEPDVILYQLIQTALAVRFATLGMDVRTIHQVPGPLYLENRSIRRVERFLARLDDAIICGTAYTRQKYLELSYPSDRLFTVPFGVPIPGGEIRDRGDQLRQQWGLSQDTFAVVMVAYFYPPKRTVFRGRGIKGHEDLLDAWFSFSRRHPDARLLLVGEGWGATGDHYYNSVRDHSRHMIHSGSVLWIEGQRDSRPFYAMADISVSPSLSEGHGAALEAGANSVPSIVSDAGGLPETVAVGKTGWVFPAGNSLELLDRLEQAYRAHESNRLHTMGQRARELVTARFDAQQCAQQVADIIEGSTRN